ncbi:MAG: UDP-N-acetylenolpyruvoylglucosamine reductase [Candidatus Cloacimonadota bacterium]|nr:MAG: UDP-N-acetylenolpyruvoylglucosamine reductase [Candidatus Cloacimonadota bacterium]
MIEKGLLLKDFSTWKIGGKLSYYLLAKKKEDILEGLRFCLEKKLALLLIGNGSNVLFDEDFKGLMIRIDKKFELSSIEDNLLAVSAGQMLSRAVKLMNVRTWSSMDPLSTIPGNVGGSLVNNAGAFGLEISDFVHSVEGFDFFGIYKKIEKKDIDFKYRYCSLRGNFLITQVNFFNFEKIYSDVNFRTTRKSTQPLNYPSAGCIFKNPKGDSAGRLIDLSDCKKMSVGGAEVSEVHANFIINKQGASSQEIKDLIKVVQLKVKKHSGFDLTRELQYSSEISVMINN